MSNGFIMLDLEGLAATPEELELVSNPRVCGVILFARNYESVEQLVALTGALRKLKPELLIAVDQEGGRVQRFKGPFTRIPPMRVLGDCFQREPIKALQAARSCGWLLASELLAVGVDFSFAPVLDLDTGNSSVIGDRAFDGDPGVVSILASCLIDGMHEAGMSVVGKHFPGHGSVTADSHLELPVDTRGLEVMMEQDMIPFGRLAAKLDAVMPAHVLYSAVDSVPAGISSVWLQEILRAKLGFEGLIISDDLSMEGIAGSGDYYTRGQKSLEAGCDILLACNNRAGVRELLKLPVNNQAAIQSQLHRMLGKQVFEFNTLKNTERWNIALKTIKALED